MANHSYLDDFDASAASDNLLAQLRASVDASDFSQIASWLEKHTTHPRSPTKKSWNFREHEYQIDILNDSSHEAYFQKCSQVGASELFIRKMLAMLGMSEALTLIYVLPSANFAQKFSKGRIDPVINNSPALRNLRNKDVDSVSMKQFGNSFLYIQGTRGQSAAISIPAQALFWDEVDFCDQDNLTTYRSRLGACKEDDQWFIRGFSTPTVYDFGINKYFKSGSQAFYGVWCAHCKDFVEVQFLRDVEVPGFELDMTEWSRDHVDDPTIKIDDAFFRCAGCRNPLIWENFLDPEKRKWVHKYPERAVRTRQINPFDVPAVNPPARTLREIRDSVTTWVNYKVGVPYEDATTGFMADSARVEGTMLAPPLTPQGVAEELRRLGISDDKRAIAKWAAFQPRVAGGCTLGVDFGKPNWFVVLHPQGVEKVILHYSRVHPGVLRPSVWAVYLFFAFGCHMGVGDAGPEYNEVQDIVRALPEYFWACYYTATRDGGMQRLKLKPEEGVVTALRTRSLDLLAQAFNAGRFVLTRGPELDTFKAHLKATKRVSEQKEGQRDQEKGERERAIWVKTGDDHFAHALNYANIAQDLLYSLDGYAATGDTVIGVTPGFQIFKLRR